MERASFSTPPRPTRLRGRHTAACLVFLMMFAPALAFAAQPDLGVAFRERFGKLADAAPNASEKEFAALAAGLAVPSHRAWFTRIFGDVEGQKLAERYQKLLPKLVWRLQKDLSYNWPGIGTEFGVELWSKEKESVAQGLDKSLLAALKQPAWYYEVAIVPPGRKTRWPFALFFYVDGAYRYVPVDIFSSLRQVPARVSVKEPKLIHQEQAEYPAAARAKKIEGTVRLEVVVAPLGWVLECRVVSGDPALAPTARAAVRKWIFEPTLLNGAPVEIQTTVEAVFTLPR